MHVTHVITRLIVGGAQENTLASVLGLRQRPGFTVDLVSGPTTGPEGSLESRVSGFPGLLTVVPELVRPVAPWHDLLAWRRLVQLFRQTRPQVVHTHSGKAGVLGRLAARQARVPLVLHTIHGPSFGPWQGRLANAVFLRAERAAVRATDHFVVVAHAMTRQYLAAGLGHPRQYTRIFSGFDLEPFLHARRSTALAAQLGLGPDDFVVGKVARLFELKGHDELFQAAPQLLRRCPRLKLLLVGDGPWRGRFEEIARRAGLRDRVIFTGLVPPEEVPHHLALMDVLVHLSRREGLARALPQALAAGIPVVAADADGAAEVCLDGETGFLVPPDQPEILVDRVGRLADSRELRRRLGSQGREFVRQRFSTGTMVDELARLYTRLGQEKGLPSPDAGREPGPVA